jgi:hypothetical protein
VRCIELRLQPEGKTSVSSETYVPYVKPFEPSLRSRNYWVADDQKQALAVCSRPTGATFAEDCRVEVFDEPYENGALGKHVIFHVTERPRGKG